MSEPRTATGEGAEAVAPGDLPTVLHWLIAERTDCREPKFLQCLTDRLAAATDADHVAIARFYDSILPPPAVWVAALTVRGAPDLDRSVAGEALATCSPDTFASLSQGHCCAIGNTVGQAADERTAPNGPGWTGGVLVPILVDGTLWGLIGIADTRRAQPVDAHGLAALKLIAGGLSERVVAGKVGPVRSEPVLSEAFGSVGEPLVVYDADLRVAWYNPAWRASVSYVKPGEDLLGLLFVDISRVNVEKGYWTPQRADEVFRDFASRRFTISRERTTNIGGSYLRHRNYPLSTGGFVGMRTDITDLVLRHTELDEAKSRAEAASRAKSAFLATVSHELRTPLNAIIGFSDLMRSGVFGPLMNERYAGYAADIHRSGLLLLSLIDDLLDMARIEAGKVELRPEPISVYELLTDVIRIVDLRASGQNLTLGRDVPPGLPRVVIDQRATVQILLNVVGNAIKFTPSGGRIVIGVRPEGTAALCIAIADNGPGIDPRDLPRLGRPFERADGEVFGIAQKNRGTGLGLAISRSLAESQGGVLRIHSELGSGTTVELLLPVAGVATSAGGATPPSSR